uniref:Major facilitator superfamily domain containing 4B n=1 Tax=Scleropages formosus TaxID=113540 RepID=A0A8C9VC64_SCLFO
FSCFFLGPTLGDLAINVKQNISNISHIFLGRSAGSMGGSLLAGFLLEVMNHHILLGFSMLLTAFGMAAIPFCRNAVLLTALMSCIGISMGSLNTGRSREKKSILGSKTNQLLTLTQNSSISPVTTMENKSLDSILHFTHSESSTLKSMWAYIMIGAFALFVSLLFFIMYFRITLLREPARATSGKQIMAKHHNVLIFFLSFFFFWYVGTEVAYGSFIYTYAKDYIHLDTSQAAGLNSLFWGTYAATRGLAIFFAACMKPGSMIVLSLLASSLSSLLLSLFSSNMVILWSCTALYGASMATTFPSGISWLKQYTTVTGRSAAMFLVGSVLGTMVLPALIGFLLGKVQELPVLMYLSLATAIITSIIFPIMYKLATSPSRSGQNPQDKKPPEISDSEHCIPLRDMRSNQGDEEQEADLLNKTSAAATLVLESSPVTFPTCDPSTEPVSPSALSASDSPERRPVLS